MVDALTKSFQDFFKLLPDSISVYKSVSVKVELVLKVFRNVSEQYISAEGSLQNSEASDERDLLWFQILEALEKEMIQLQIYRDELEAVRDRTALQFEKLEMSYFKNRVDRLLGYGGVLPPVYRLIELAEDVKRFFDASNIHLSSAFLNLSYCDLSTVDRWIKAWKEALEIPDYLNRITAETSALFST